MDPRLSDEEIERLVSKLKRGEYLEDYYRPLLFREAKEVELAYAAKETKSQILSSTMAVPLQPLKRYGEAAEGNWTNKLVVGDNLQVLKTLLEIKNRGELKNADGSNGVRLCYIDPPFATKQEFQGARGQRAYRDKIAGAEFVEFLRKRLVFIRELLSEDGVLYLHLDTRKAHYIKVLLDEIFGEHNFRAEIVWQRTSAHTTISNYGRIHETLLFYSKSQLYRWTPQYQPYSEAYIEEFYTHEDPDGRRWMRSDLTRAGIRRGETGQPWRGIDVTAKGRHWAVPPTELDRLDGESKIHWPAKKDGMPRLKIYAEEQPGVTLQDIWTDIKPMHNLSSERVGYPTQKPLELLERIIRASTDEGDLVLDCFAGSGTAAVAAERLGRRWIANDAGKLAIYLTQRRLLATSASDNRKSPSSPRPFDLCTAGMYDNSLLEGLDFESYKRFCLDLFECRQEQFKISGITFAGRRKGEPVHLFPFNLAPDLQMGVDYLESLHERLKGKVSGAVFVIVPITHCDPGLFADVFPMGKILFFVLRVPYSAIEAIHGRPFKVLDQPFSEADLNDPVDTFGFDFVQLPDVDVRYVRSGDDLHVVVNSFKRGGLDPDDFDALEEKGRLDLSMVMVDRSYDGEVFRVSDYFFGDQLEDNGWSFSLPLKAAGKHFFFVFMDTHGNELREPIEISTVKSGAKPRVKKPKVKTARAAEEVEADEGLEEVAAGG
jgi:site-specific DNA-methyltransferase (adenine-specific)/adenine-specific DNA-methyltransferase